MYTLPFPVEDSLLGGISYHTAFPVPQLELVCQEPLSPGDRIQILSSQDAAELLRRCYPIGKIALQECFYVMMLNTANFVLGVSLVHIGGIASTVVDVRLVVIPPLLAGATRLILAHNHPSGNLKPSTADLNITQKIVQGANLLQLTVLDHFILGPSRGAYYSMADEGTLPRVPSQAMSA